MRETAESGNRLFVTFHMGEQYYGVDIRSVREVNSEFRMTDIPHSPDEVVGYVNLRGQIHLIIDLRPLLSLPESMIPLLQRKLIIFKEKIGEPFGIIVDDVGDVITISEERIEEFNLQDSMLDIPEQPYEQGIMNGICKLDQSLMVTIDAESILRIIAARMENYESTDRR